MKETKFQKNVKPFLKPMKIWKGDKLVHDFVPCFRKQDGEFGIYDRVNNQFYTDLKKGADV